MTKKERIEFATRALNATIAAADAADVAAKKAHEALRFAEVAVINAKDGAD